MSYFSYRQGRLHAEQVDLIQVAEEFGTPAYVYSRAALIDNYQAYAQALVGTDHLVCYAVKANSNLAVLGVLATAGAGFDIVSIGELKRVLAAGGSADKTVFSGVGKQAHEIEQALEAGILCFNVESEAELRLINQIAERHATRAPISLRINPDVDPKSHPYISTGLKENKFGIDIGEAERVYAEAAALPFIEIIGVDCHIGSQLTSLSPFVDALERVLKLIDRLAARDIVVRHLDLGGGLGVTYRDETPPPVKQYVGALLERLAGRDLTLILEPGRSIAANAGVLLTRVAYIKENGGRKFAIVDAAMNDMIRPALYDAWLDIQPVDTGGRHPEGVYDVVGPVCETGDFLGTQRSLAIAAGDILCVHGAGAYGFSMSSNYNSRPRAAEIMVDGEHLHLVRARESLEDLMRGEQLLTEPGT